MGHQGLICRECGSEPKLSELRPLAADEAASLTCPQCQSQSFGI